MDGSMERQAQLQLQVKYFILNVGTGYRRRVITYKSRTNREHQKKNNGKALHNAQYKRYRRVANGVKLSREKKTRENH